MPKYWFEQHGTIPAVMTHDVLEFTVPAPVSRKQAMKLAQEQYAWWIKAQRMPRLLCWPIAFPVLRRGTSGGIESLRKSFGISDYSGP